MALFTTEHSRLTAAGWSYRLNERGRVIYRDPVTAEWHLAAEAMAILDGRPAARAA
jgi:hypothetical protein